MVSTELTSSCISEEEKPGDAEDPSLGSMTAASRSDWVNGEPSEVMLHSTEAASSNWTC